MKTAKSQQRILPGKASRKRGDYGIMFATCPICFVEVRSDLNPPVAACPHLYRIFGGCGVAAAFEFRDPPEVY